MLSGFAVLSRVGFISVLTLFLLLQTSAVTEAGQPQTVPIGIDEKLGDIVPIDEIFFKTEDGATRSLSELMNNKPTVIALVYYRCPGICSPLLTEFSKTLDKIDLNPKTDYQALTISFDPTETPQLAGEKKTNYLRTMKAPIPEASWSFLTGDSSEIAGFTDAVGFQYMKDTTPRRLRKDQYDAISAALGTGLDLALVTGSYEYEEDTDTYVLDDDLSEDDRAKLALVLAQGGFKAEYIHSGSLVVLSKEGKISRYLFGTDFLPFDLKMALVEASDGRVGPTITKVLQYCFSYDPAGRKYKLNITRVAGSFILLMLGLFIGYLAVKRVRRKS